MCGRTQAKALPPPAFVELLTQAFDNCGQAKLSVWAQFSFGIISLKIRIDFGLFFYSLVGWLLGWLVGCFIGWFG